jgi:predicted dienelactone hydrolase
MQLFEVLFCLFSILLLVLLSFFGKRRKFQTHCFQIGLFVLILHVLVEIARWQMAFCYLVFFLMALMLLKRSTSHLFFRILGFISGLFLIATSSFYSIMMPIIELPAPSGAYKIGSTNYTVTDESRDETQTDYPNDKRELFVEVWYPANLEELEDIPDTKPLWQELYTGELDRVSFFVNYLKGIDTHTYPDVPPNLDNGPFSVILFSHGLQMFTSQSTLLMEHLASHGYIVVSIAHPYESLRVNLPNAGTVMPEFITSMEKFKEAMTWIEKNSAPIFAAKDSMDNIQNREERAQIMLRTIENSEMNTVVSEWEKDTRFILNQLVSSSGLRLVFQNSIDTSRIGVMGMSIGGAVATEFSKADVRIKAGINIDGLQYGSRNNEGLNVPFMMIYSKDGKGMNDFLMLNSKDDFYELTFANARHADFTDMNLIWPVMRIYGQLGDIPGERMTQLTNEVILNFWDSYLKNKTFQNFEKKDYPELEITNKVNYLGASPRGIA